MSGSSRLAYHAVPRILAPEERSRLNSTNKQHHCSDNSSKLSTCSTSTMPVEYHELNSAVKDCNQVPVVCAEKEISSDELERLIKSLNSDIERVISTVDWSPFEDYLMKTRLNLNVRQVFKRQSDTS